MPAPTTITPAMLRISLWRRLAAMLYDTIALFGVLFAAGAVVLILRKGDPVGPISGTAGAEDGRSACKAGKCASSMRAPATPRAGGKR
jgi:hypothetical protein